MKAWILTALLVLITAKAHAGTRVVLSEERSFEACVATIQATATKLGVAPTNIVETTILRIVRFNTNDGSGKSILVTCSGPDKKMIVNESW